jgi:hypothetical protein
MRLRYGGSAHRWGNAIYTASTNSYEDQIWFSGSTEKLRIRWIFVCGRRRIR